MMLIGLNGRLGAGKDTAANILVEMLSTDYEVRTTAFASPLKVSAAAVFGLTLEQLEELKLWPGPMFTVRLLSGEVIEITGRQYLERYGTEAHRNVFGQTFWLDQALPPNTLHEHEVIIFTDCRFPNEAERVKGQGGFVVEIVGPNGREGNGHPSDSPLPYHLIDYFVDNVDRDEGSMRHLQHGLWKVLMAQGVSLSEGIEVL